MARGRPPAPWTQTLDLGAAPTQRTILDGLRHAILDGRAPPGTAIALDDVAARFAVSRIPVREALKTLVGEGLVDHEDGSGYCVARLTTGELVELYIVRAALETAGLTAAASRAGAADDVEAADSYAALTVAIATGDAPGHHRESRRFHFALLAPCAMPRLLRMYESAWNLTEPLRPMSHVAPESTVALHEDHREMLTAFRSRDTAALVAASEMHHQRLQAIAASLV